MWPSIELKNTLFSFQELQKNRDNLSSLISRNIYIQKKWFLRCLDQGYRFESDLPHYFFLMKGHIRNL